MSRKKVEKNIAFDEEKNLYYVTMDYGKDSSGKRNKPTKTFTKIKDARQALKEFEADKTKKTLVIPTSITFEEWINYWIDNKRSIEGLEETTIYGYKNIINNHLIPYFGTYKLQGINPTLINKYFKKKFDEELSSNTIRKHYDLLKSTFQYAIEEDKLLKNPINKIKRIKIEKKEMSFYNVEQLKKLFQVVENDRMEIVVKLAGLLGLRREEIAGLKWKYVDLDNEKITIHDVRVQAGKSVKTRPRPKNKSSNRTLHIPEEIKHLLLKIKSEQNERKKIIKSLYNKEGYVMAWEDGSPYRPNYLSDLFKKIITDNKLPPIRLHDLRHTFVSIANDLGVNLYDISKALGHSQIGTTSNIYTHLFDETHEKTINKIADVFKINSINDDKNKNEKNKE